MTLLAIVCALCGCNREPKTERQRGAGLFLRLCSGCHGQDGRGAKRPGFQTPPRNLTDPVFQSSLSDEDIRRTIERGKGQMPAFGKLLPEEEITAIIAYIRTLDASKSTRHRGPSS